MYSTQPFILRYYHPLGLFLRVWGVSLRERLGSSPRLQKSQASSISNKIERKTQEKIHNYFFFNLVRFLLFWGVCPHLLG